MIVWCLFSRLCGPLQIQKTYPLVHTKVEESGEHVLFGLGEIALDSVMHDLRVMFSQVSLSLPPSCCLLLRAPADVPVFVILRCSA